MNAINSRLSERMKMVAGLITKGHRVADIGCDHAFVSIYLVQNRIAPCVVALDVRPGPLGIAEKNVKSYGMEGKISIRLSDGFQALQDGETDTAVLAGMGGPLIVRLLEQGRRVIHKGYELVLQPQSELDTVRKYLRTHGYSIVQEAMLKEDGKYYTAMKVVKHTEAAVTGVDAREEALQKIQDLYGAYLIEQHSPVLMEYLETELQKRKEIQKSLLLHTTNKSRNRLAELEQEVDLLQQAIALTKREKR